mmetsp:Transcript_29060/g.78642  ORF Transcript_29060/g.78642 Transcript_29060/m.78642 type:complete len:248 (+) Transcript_29060:134-877(+)
MMSEFIHANFGTTMRNTRKQPLRCRHASSPTVNSFQLLVVVSIMLVMMRNSAEGFSLSPSISCRDLPSPLMSRATPFQSQLNARVSGSDDIDEDEDDKERVLARVRRRRGRGAYADDDLYDDLDDEEYAGSGRSRRNDESVNYAADMLEDEGIFEEMDDEYYDDDDIENDESYDTFSNTVIPNQLLDSIDPDGSAERFSELASDPRFWFDIFLFITVLDFISFIGPRNPFLDLVPEMYTAGLPPPGI